MSTMPKELANTIVDPEAYAHWERSHAAFTELRRTAPLSVAEPDGYDPFWAVTKYDDIKTVEKNGALFSSARQLPLRPRAVLEQASPDELGQKLRTLVNMDDPEHFKQRIITQAWFMPRNLRNNLESRVREIAREFVERMLEFDGECDFARDVAFLYPLRVVMEVIGVPPSDEARMLTLTQELFGDKDPDLGRAGRNVDAVEAAKMREAVLEDFVSYFKAMQEDRQANPRADLASVIANAEIDGEPIGFYDAMGYYIITATAGHDTTSASTTSGCWALAERPQMLADLKNDASLLDGFVQETIRWETPVKQFMRTATEDTEVSGKKIAEGDRLMLRYPSGNRDEDQFDKPFEFDMRRFPNKHIAFGFGIHVCLGQHLARLEMRLLWEEMLPRIASIELNGEPTRSVSNFVCGPKSVPIRFTKA